MGSRYLEPTTVKEAAELAGEHGADAAFVVGGTDLVVRARRTRTALPPVLIALHRVPALRELHVAGDGSLRIGAAVPHAVLVTEPALVGPYTALSDGAALVGSPATRHVGTLGGNLCNASPANDTGSPLLCFDAAVELTSATDSRTVPLEGFFRGPGVVDLQPGELLSGVVLPAPGHGEGSAYLRLDYRQAMEIAVVGAAARVRLEPDGTIGEASLALTAVAQTCVLVPEVAEALSGGAPSAERLREAGELAAAAARPIGDVRAPADYRRAMVPVIARRALGCAIRRALGDVIPVPAPMVPSFSEPGKAA